MRIYYKQLRGSIFNCPYGKTSLISKEIQNK